MLMRYYLGLGVGHAHQSGKGCRFSTDGKSREDGVEEIEEDVQEEALENENRSSGDGDDSGSDNASNIDEDLSGDDDSEEDYSDDGELVAIKEMYGLSFS